MCDSVHTEERIGVPSMENALIFMVQRWSETYLSSPNSAVRKMVAELALKY